MFDLPDKTFYNDSEFPENLPGIPDFIYKEIRNSLQHGKVLKIDYQDFSGAESTRLILPEVLFESGGRWYTGAYCYLREEERSFRLDRIAALSDSGLKDNSRGVASLYRERENLPKIPFMQSTSAQSESKIAGSRVKYSRRSFPDDTEIPLLKAALAQNPDAVLHLLENGANPSELTGSGLTVFEEYQAHYPGAFDCPESCEGEIYDLMELFRYEGFAEFFKLFRNPDMKKLYAYPQKVLKFFISSWFPVHNYNPVDITEESRRNTPELLPDTLLEEIYDFFLEISEENRLKTILSLEIQNSPVKEKYIRMLLKEEGMSQQSIDFMFQKENIQRLTDFLLLRAEDTGIL